MNIPTVIAPKATAESHSAEAAIAASSIDGKQPTMDALATLYKSQNRECWLCDKISRKFSDGLELSDDDQWHFTSCVLSWEYVHKH